MKHFNGVIMKKILIVFLFLAITVNISSSAQVTFDVETDSKRVILEAGQTNDTELYSVKAEKTNVLELDNTTAFTPDADYEPATKKYVDDNSGGAGNVSTSGTPIANDYARFVDGVDIEGRSYTEVKTDLSLDNVDNTSDVDKSVSTDTQTALDAKTTEENGTMNYNVLTIPDGVYAGTKRTGADSDVTVIKNQLVHLDSSGGYVLADANLPGAFPANGVATEAGTAGNPLEVTKEGLGRDDTWTWTPGLPIYLDVVAGGLSQAGPTVSDECWQPVGMALTATIIEFDINDKYGWGVRN